MAGFAGPRANDNSLVFGYDTGYGLDTNKTSTRFYQGEPIDNIWSDSWGQSVNELSSWSAPMQSTAGLTQTVMTETWNGNRIWKLERTAGNLGTYDSWRRCVAQPLAGSYSSTRFVSMKICTPFDDPVSELSIHTGGGNSGHNASYFTKIPIKDVPKDAPYRDKWYNFHAPANWSSTTVVHCVGLAFRSGNASTFLTSEPMYYASSHQIPFTPTDRSSTQSLLDLSGNTTIDVSNVSFDSSGQPTFDGTDDVIQLSTALVDSLSTAELTVEAIVYHTSWGATSSSRPYIANWNTWDNTTPNQRGFILRTFGTEQFPRFWWCWGANYSNVSAQGATFNLNQFHHVVGVYKKDSYAKIYVDGVEAGSTTSNVGNHLVYDDTTGTRIGYGTINTGRFVGDLPVIKLYNRALTGNEVLKNYNQYKNRFSLL